MKHCLILENIRSAYNVGTLVRSADALGRSVIVSGFSPDPRTEPKVQKTSLWAEESVPINQFRHTRDALDVVRDQWYLLVAAEITADAVVFGDRLHALKKNGTFTQPIALIVGNENDGICDETLQLVDHICYIPMQGAKESMNVAQVGAMMMWGISSCFDC